MCLYVFPSCFRSLGVTKCGEALNLVPGTVVACARAEGCENSVVSNFFGGGLGYGVVRWCPLFGTFGLLIYWSLRWFFTV